MFDRLINFLSEDPMHLWFSFVAFCVGCVAIVQIVALIVVHHLVSF